MHGKIEDADSNDPLVRMRDRDRVTHAAQPAETGYPATAVCLRAGKPQPAEGTEWPLEVRTLAARFYFAVQLTD